MPAIPKPSANGHAKRFVIKQRTALEEALRGTDDIEIGLPEDKNSPEEKVEVATMTDVAKLIGGVRYLVKDWIPFGMLTGLIGEPGTGKSALALWIARTVMTGEDWFTGLRGPEPSPVLWCGTENDLAITCERTKKWKVPTDSFLFPFKDDPLKSIDLKDDAHISRITSVVSARATKLVVVDSLRGAQDDDENNSRVGHNLKKLGEVAQATNAAILVVHHTKKIPIGQDLTANSSRGSNAIQAYFRAMIGVERPQADSKWVRMRLLKENLGVSPKPIGYCPTDDGVIFGEAPQRGQKNSQLAQVIEWLRHRLVPGKSENSKELDEEGLHMGFSQASISRARRHLGVRATKDGNVWKCHLPLQELNKGPSENDDMLKS